VPPASTANGGGANSDGTEDGAATDLPAGFTPPSGGRRLLGRKNKKR
jgi:hypothetical protein